MEERPSKGLYWSTRDIKYLQNRKNTERFAGYISYTSKKDRLEALVTTMPGSEITYAGTLALKVAMEEGEQLLDADGHEIE